MTVAHVAAIVNWPVWLTATVVIGSAGLVSGVIFGILKEIRERRKERAERAAAAKSTAPYKERWRAKLLHARAETPGAVMLKPKMEKGDDPEVFERAWLEFDEEQKEIFNRRR